MGIVVVVVLELCVAEVQVVICCCCRWRWHVGALGGHVIGKGHSARAKGTAPHFAARAAWQLRQLESLDDSFGLSPNGGQRSQELGHSFIMATMVLCSEMAMTSKG